MTSPWDLYDQLIDEIPADITVTQIFTDGKWRRVASSEDGVGMAFGMNVQSRPRSGVTEAAQNRRQALAALGMIAGMVAINALAFRVLYEVYGA